MYTNGLKSHHVTIIPAKPLMNAKMNTSATTTCGYAGSDMVGIIDKTDVSCTKTKGTGTLDTIYEEYIKDDFTYQGTERVIPYQNLLTKTVDINATNNRMGNNGIKGASSNWDWYTRKIDLMSEMNVYGGIVASSSIYDTGIDNRQYAIFRLKPELINSYKGTKITYWLKDIASSDRFALVNGNGDSITYSANDSRGGVRPRFLIGEFFNSS